MTSSIRLAIAEDHQAVAEAMATMLGSVEGIEIVGVCTSGTSIIELDAAESPDVILMDVRLQGLNGVEAIHQIVAARPAARIVVLTVFDDGDTVTSAMAAGALGFLPRDAGRDDVVAAVRALAAGEGYLHASVTRTFLERVGPLARQALAAERLTEREHQVLALLADGGSTREIAAALVLGEETVKTHLTHIYQKLGVTDRVQAVALAIRAGLIA